MTTRKGLVKGIVQLEEDGGCHLNDNNPLLHVRMRITSGLAYRLRHPRYDHPHRIHRRPRCEAPGDALH
jgi:hypothetical protein